MDDTRSKTNNYDLPANPKANTNGDHLKLQIWPLPGMVSDYLDPATPFTEISESRKLLLNDTPPDLPPRSGNTGSQSPFIKPAEIKLLQRPLQTLSLIQFAQHFSKQFPRRIKVTKGFYGSTHSATLSGQEELVVLYEKKREVLRIRSNSGNTYSIPLGSNIPLSLLYDPNNNPSEALKGTTFKSLAAFREASQLPKVIASTCNVHSKTSSLAQSEILILTKLDLVSRKLHAQCLSNDGQSTCDKEFPLHSQMQDTFTTNPDSIGLYLSDIVKYVHSPCSKELAQTKALLQISKLPSKDAQALVSTDPSLKEPVTMIEMATEDSLVVIRDEPNKEYDSCPKFEIALDGTLPIEVTVLERQSDHFIQDHLDRRSKFDPTKSEIWGIENCEDSQVVQRIFNSLLRSGHEMDGVVIPEQVYEETPGQYEVAYTLPVSIPVSPLIPRGKESIQESPSSPDGPPLVVQTAHSLDTPPTSSMSTEQDSPLLEVQKELVALREKLDTLSRTQRLPSTSSDFDLPLDYEPLVSSAPISQDRGRLTSSDLCEIVSELVDCEGLWYFMIIYMGVPKSKVDQISATHSYDPNSCRRGLLEGVSYWLDNVANPTWSCITKALYKLEKKNVAREIAKKYGATLPSTEIIQDPISSDLSGHLTSEKIQEVKFVQTEMQKKSEKLHDVNMSMNQQQEKLDRLKQELSDVKDKLKFFEEYTLVLTRGSQMADWKKTSMERRQQVLEDLTDGTDVRKEANELSLALDGMHEYRDAYERRLKSTQSEATKLQQQLVSIEKQCRDVTKDLYHLHDRKCSLSLSLSQQEYQFNQMITGNYREPAEEADHSEEQTLEPPDYYNIILHNGKIEQRLHQQEVTKLQEDLLLKEDRVKVLNEKLRQTQDRLAEVERKLLAQQSDYSYAHIGNDLIQNESMKTTLQAEKVDYQLQLATTHFSRKEVESRLHTQQKKLQRTKKINQKAETLRSTAKKISRVSSGRCSTSSEESDVFMPNTSRPQTNSRSFDCDNPLSFNQPISKSIKEKPSLNKTRPKGSGGRLDRSKPISKSTTVADRSRPRVVQCQLRRAISELDETKRSSAIRSSLPNPHRPTTTSTKTKKPVQPSRLGVQGTRPSATNKKKI